MSLYQVSSGDRILAADLNQFYSILKGVAASGESVTLIYNAAGAVILQPSSDPAVGTQLFQLKNNAGTVKAAMTAGGGALFSSQVLLAQSSTISSAGTTDLSTATGNYAQISGTTTITAFGTVQAGTLMILEFQGILTLTHNASSLILRSGANATTAAGDVYAFVSEGSGNWREVWHLNAGSALPAVGSEGQALRVVGGVAAYASDAFSPDRWGWSFIPGMTMRSTVTGTGSYTAVAGAPNGSLATGATSGSNSGLDQTLSIGAALTGLGGTNKLRYWVFKFYLGQIDANTDIRIFITDENVTTQPSLTARHVGIRATTSSTVLFSTADNTTEQSTAITGSVNAATEYQCAITFDGTTAKCYINGTLVATHATNVPGANAGVGPTFRAHVLNSAASSKTFSIGPTSATVAA